MKLSIPEFQIGKEKSEKYVLLLCKELKLPVKDLRNTIKLDIGGQITEINLPKEVDFVRRNGKASTLQFMFDSNDRFLNTPLSVGIPNNVKGVKIELKSNYGAHSTGVNSPGYIEAPEASFSDDISYYRKEVVRAFNENDFSGFARAYRAYLQSCISLLECFIHRYAFHLKTMIPSTLDYQNTAILDSRRPIEDRLEAWMTTFATHKMDEYKNSKYRSKFIELKMQRNEIVHPAYPSIGYGIQETVRYLNYAQDGVGGFLSELRRYTGYSENIGFIRQVKTQAEIKIVKNA